MTGVKLAIVTAIFYSFATAITFVVNIHLELQNKNFKFFLWPIYISSGIPCFFRHRVIDCDLFCERNFVHFCTQTVERKIIWKKIKAAVSFY